MEKLVSMNWKPLKIDSLQVLSFLFKPVDIYSLVFFRLAYGLIMILTFVLVLDQFDIKTNWIDPQFHFHYIGFEWVNPLPGPYMYLLFVLLIFLAVFICIGYHYILSCSLFSLGLTYFLLINQIVWDTYFYLAWWISLILIFVPAHKKFSCDAWKNRGCSSETAPAWTVWILRFQVAMPYLFGGVTKLNEDWLRGFVTKGLFAPRTHLPFIGQFCEEPWFIYGTAYGGLLLDLFLVPMVIFRPFRKLGLISLFLFHIFNFFVTNVGFFALFMLVTTLILLPPSWPRDIFGKFRKSPFSKVDHETRDLTPDKNQAKLERWTIFLLSIYVILQLLIPLRHHLLEGNVHWTEEGIVFSWGMRSSIKRYKLDFFLFDKEKQTKLLIRKRDFFTAMQIEVMATDPDKILQAAHHIAEKYLETHESQQIAVTVRSRLRLNGRKSQLLIDPEVDLLTKGRTFKHKDWIMPLVEPLPATLFH